MKKRKWLPAFLLFLLLLGAATFLYARAQAYPEPPDTVTLQRDVCYGNADGQPLLMDIISPKNGQSPYPAVFCIHGGGWAAGHKKDMLGCAYMLSQLGFVTATVDYRLVPHAHFPAQFDDVKAAVRYLRSHASELKIDPLRIGALGSSAGGHLALLLGTVGDTEKISSAVSCVVSLAGPTDLLLPLPEDAEKIAERFIGKSRQERPELFKNASPVNFLSRGDATILMIHGDSDKLVPYDQATTMLSACRKAGVPAELITVTGGGHGGGGKKEDWDSSIMQMAEFLRKNLQP